MKLVEIECARSQAEIAAQIKAVEEHDFLGIEAGDLLEFADYATAKPYINDDCTEAKWEEAISEIRPPIAQARLPRIRMGKGERLPRHIGQPVDVAFSRMAMARRDR